MRSPLVFVVLIALLALPPGSAAAQTAASPFEDVPPWHWAFDAVAQLARAGIIQGYPRDDRELARNALTQVYDAFAHPSHPAARAWAEAFLTNLPAPWPAPLERSVLTAYRLSVQQVRLRGTRGAVDVLAVAVLRGGTLRTRFTAAVVRDEGGRWRVDYASLAAAQPQLFR
ncbi:MAG TPA: S-layer homology domain-containing protein [bacterium]|nr:S-layer homology domain-containing protein [bacterium]